MPYKHCEISSCDKNRIYLFRIWLTLAGKKQSLIQKANCRMNRLQYQKFILLRVPLSFSKHILVFLLIILIHAKQNKQGLL